MIRFNMTAIFLLGTLLLALAAATIAAEEFNRNKLRVVQATDERSLPEIELSPPTDGVSSSDRARPLVPDRAPQPPRSESPMRRQDGAKSAAPSRDPTQPDEQLRDLVAPIRMGLQAGKGGTGISLPQIVLKGRIVGPLKAPAALIAVDETLHILRQGSELTVPSPNVGLGSLTLKVSELTTTEVRIEIMPLRQAIVLR